MRTTNKNPINSPVMPDASPVREPKAKEKQAGDLETTSNLGSDSSNQANALFATQARAEPSLPSSAAQLHSEWEGSVSQLAFVRAVRDLTTGELSLDEAIGRLISMAVHPEVTDEIAATLAHLAVSFDWNALPIIKALGDLPDVPVPRFSAELARLANEVTARCEGHRDVATFQKRTAALADLVGVSPLALKAEDAATVEALLSSTIASPVHIGLDRLGRMVKASAALAKLGSTPNAAEKLLSALTNRQAPAEVILGAASDLGVGSPPAAIAALQEKALAFAGQLKNEAEFFLVGEETFSPMLSILRKALEPNLQSFHTFLAKLSGVIDATNTSRPPSDRITRHTVLFSSFAQAGLPNEQAQAATSRSPSEDTGSVDGATLQKVRIVLESLRQKAQRRDEAYFAACVDG